MANLSASVVAGRRIREARQRRGWTAEELAERCAGAGAPQISATVITNVETSRRSTRKVSLEELLILASVLEVTPLQLMLPLGPGERLEVLPGTGLDALEAVRWIAGDTPGHLVAWTLSALPESTGNIVRSRLAPTDMIRLTGVAEARIGQLAGIADGSPGTVRVIGLIADRLMYLAAQLEDLGYEAPGLDSVRDILKHHGLPLTVSEWRDRAAEAEVPGDEG